MKTTFLGFVAIALLTGSSAGTGIATQVRPSFSGTWRAADQPQALSITQSPSQLALMQTVGPLEHKFVYQLDGSLSQNQTSTVTGEKWMHASRARWVGPALVVTTTTTRGSTNRSWDWMATYFLSSNGQLAIATLDGVLTSDQAMDLRTVLFNKQ